MKKNLCNARAVIVSVLLFSLFVVQLNAQPALQWVKSWGGVNGDLAQAATMDAAGNLYVIGTFSTAADLDPGPGTALFTTTLSLPNVYVTKFDAAGNFQWAKQLGINSAEGDQAIGIKLDAAGNIYVLGNFTGTADFDPGPGVFNLSTPALTIAIFIAKLDAAGNFIWAKAINPGVSAFSAIESAALAVDATGNIYYTGYFAETVDFDPGPGIANLATSYSRNVFISKLDASGNFVWAKGYYSAGSISQSTDITVDATGNVYTTGYFFGTMDFDPGPGTQYRVSSVSSNDIFVSKLDASGNYLWVNTIGSAAQDRGYGIHLDAAGNVYVTGEFALTVDFDPGPGTANLTSVGSTNIFVWKLDAAGNYILARAMGSTDNCVGNSITTDAAGNIYIAGTFYGTADFDPGPATANLTSPSNANSAFAVVLNSSGNYTWAERFGGTGFLSSTSAYTILTDPVTGNIYLVGEFTGTTDFDPDPATAYYLTPVGGGDAFLLKLGPGIITGAVTGSPFCTSSAVSVPFTASGTFNRGNVFTAQLSDASGSFASPENMGTLSGTGSAFSGTINAVIPANTPAGTHYRIRVVSSNIVATGTDNGTDLIITTTTTPAFTAIAPVCLNATPPVLPVTSNNGITGTWNALVSTATTGTTTYTFTPSAGQCATTTTMDIVVTPGATITLSSAVGTDAQTACTSNAITNITYTIGGSGSNASITTGSLPAGVTGAYNAGVFTISGTPTASGSFPYTITATGSCAPATINGTITVNTVPGVANITGPVAVCTDAAITLNDGTPGGVWSSNDGTIATVNNGVVTGVAGGAVSISYTITNACGDSSANYPVIIDLPPSLTVNADATICLGSTVSLTASTDASSTVQWSGNTGNPVTVTPTTTTTYTATATSNKNCINTAAVTVTVEDFSVTLAANPNPVVAGSPFILTTSSSLPYTITSWQPINLFPNQAANSQTLIADFTQLYTVTAKTNEGCIDTDTLTVVVISNGYDDVFVPNLFTPNADGKNDVLYVKGTVINSMSMRIYNQWGALVFETSDQGQGWDGTCKGQQQPVGVYVYVLKANLQSGITIDKKGSITLIR